MAAHVYTNAGPKETHTATDDCGQIAKPVVTHVTLIDGTDHLSLVYTDLDALDETCRMFEQARAAHIAAMLDGRSEEVAADDLRPDELAVIEGELVMVGGTCLVGDSIIVNFGRKYMDTYDMTGLDSVTLARSAPVRRLLPDAVLAVVR